MINFSCKSEILKKKQILYSMSTKIPNSITLLHIFIQLFFFAVVSKSEAQILDPNNRIDWAIAGLNEAVFPQKIEDTKALYNLSADGINNDGIKIQAALDNADPGTLLYFEAGDYLIENVLEIPANIIIRGETAGTTRFLFNLNDVGDNCIEINQYEYGDFADAISGYTKGSTTLVVSDASQFCIGSYGEIQQENDPDLMYTDSRWDVDWAENSVGQLFKIIDIQNDQLIIWPPLNITFQSTLNPVVQPNNLKENVGLENLYIERLDVGTGRNIRIKNTANCWLWNIKSNMTVRSHVWVYNSLNLQIQESYFSGSHDHGGGGRGYGVVLGDHVTNCLVENNVFKTLRHAMMVKEGANGNVFAYNFSEDPIWTGTTSTQLPPDISLHGHYPFMNLFEGNITHRLGNSDYWGPSGPGNTFLRNRVQTNDIDIEDYSHYQNVIGNEITSGSNKIDIDDSVENTLIHGNNDNGTITWDANMASQSLPNSYYLDDFWDLNEFWTNDYGFPTIGPEFTMESGSIPAKDRYLNNVVNDCFTGRSKNYSDYNFPDATVELMKNKITTSSQVTVQNNKNVELYATNYLLFNSNFEVETGAEFTAAILAH